MRPNFIFCRVILVKQLTENFQMTRKYDRIKGKHHVELIRCFSVDRMHVGRYLCDQEEVMTGP